MNTEWKLITIDEARDRASLGNKAAGLGELRRAGFRVPPGIVLSREETEAILAGNGLAEAVAGELSSLTAANVRAVSQRLSAITKDLKMPPELARRLLGALEGEGRYAVRSSATLEDLDDASFAGQYRSYLNVAPEAVPRRILDCIRSGWQEPILSYFVHHGLDPLAGGMAVIIQNMVPAEVAGVMFSVNPTTGKDTEVVIEVVRGLGDGLVEGRLTPEYYRYDWFEDKGYLPADGTLLTKGQVMLLGKGALRIQKLYGHPVDVEFAMVGGRTYALQARPVTRIGQAGLEDQWTTADFKDGGVSAEVCKPLMWSLYEYAWDTQLRRFLLESAILKEPEVHKLSRMFFGRPYWNLSVVKTAMAKVPGFREREFDAEFGVTSGYAGDGQVTRATPATLARFARIGLAQQKLLRQREAQAETLKAELLDGYDSVRLALSDLDGQALKNAWIRLVRDLYLKSEGTYFWQIFLNTIHQSVNRDAVLKYTDLPTYYALLGGLTNLSHLRPFYDLWELSRKVLAATGSADYWLETDPEELARDLDDPTREDHFLPEFRVIRARYEYHSDRELDISWPDYDEDPRPLIHSFRDTLGLGDDFSPDAGKHKVHRVYLDALESVARIHGDLARARVLKKVEKIRTMLWWREEFRDVSTRYYHLIRLYSKKLGKLLAREGILGSEDDVWFLKFEDLAGLLEGRLSPASVGPLLRRNRSYYESFRNFKSDNELGEGVDRIPAAPVKDSLVRGLPGSPGRTRGVARVVRSLDEMDRIRPGDILVTKFTDTGWTSKFAMLSGVITEYGGVLCHAAIISREYGIPCIVGAPEAMALIPDGALIVLDGATGEVQREVD